MPKDLSPCLRRSSRSPVTNRRAIFDPPLLEGSASAMVRRRVANPFVQRADVSRGCSLSRSSLDTVGYVARHLSSVRATPPNHPARKGSAFLIRSRIALPGWFSSSLVPGIRGIKFVHQKIARFLVRGKKET